MDLNATIFGQMITFAIFIWINTKFIWPKILSILNERENKILSGLQAAEQGQQKIQQAEEINKQKELETKKYCNLLIVEAKKQAEQILELAIVQAKNKGDEIINNAQLQIQKEKIKLETQLRNNLVDLIIKSTEKIIETHLKQEQHQQIIIDISNQIYEN